MECNRCHHHFPFLYLYGIERVCGECLDKALYPNGTSAIVGIIDYPKKGLKHE